MSNFTPEAEKQIRADIRRSLKSRDNGNETLSKAQMDQAVARGQDPNSRQR